MQQLINDQSIDLSIALKRGSRQNLFTKKLEINKNMSDKILSKRNRSGNFDQDDIDLFMSLVNDHKTLIDSNKQEDKKKVINW